MAKRNYIPWSSSEEKNLLPWLHQHQGLTWEQLAEEYCAEVNDGRTFESLRSKRAQLRKGIKRLRAIHPERLGPSRPTAQKARRQQRRESNSDSTIRIPVPPLLELKSRSPEAQAVLALMELQNPLDQIRSPFTPQTLHASMPRGNGFDAASFPSQTSRQAHVQTPETPCQDHIVHVKNTQRHTVEDKDGTSEAFFSGGGNHHAPSARCQEQPRSITSLWQLFRCLADGARIPKPAKIRKKQHSQLNRTSQDKPLRVFPVEDSLFPRNPVGFQEESSD
ncbi:hypothetical protein BBP40_002156 [Aspergillus hancockii]|nr:hypothetical protein BBP40_002156 [Aspergillus hancockii]